MMFHKIKNEERSDKIVEAFGGDVMLAIEVEMTTYAYADTHISGYDGGRWEFFLKKRLTEEGVSLR